MHGTSWSSLWHEMCSQSYILFQNENKCLYNVHLDKKSINTILNPSTKVEETCEILASHWPYSPVLLNILKKCFVRIDRYLRRNRNERGTKTGIDLICVLTESVYTDVSHWSILGLIVTAGYTTFCRSWSMQLL